MNINSIARLLALAALLPLAGCEFAVSPTPARVDIRTNSGDGNGPPPWAPAHGYRKKQNYRYYYNEQVYRNLDTQDWVWIESGGWRMGKALPDRFNLGPSVELALEGEQPWLHHNKVIIKHPPKHGARSAPGAKDDPPGRALGRNR